MEAGKLRHQIVIQQTTTTKGAAGGKIETTSTFATVRASKAHQSSREFFTAQKRNSETTDLFIIRYLSGVTTKMRVVFDGHTYDIIGAPDPDGRRRETHIMCKEVT